MRTVACWQVCAHFSLFHLGCACLFAPFVRPARRAPPSPPAPADFAAPWQPRLSSSAAHDAVAVSDAFSGQERCDRGREAALKHKELASRFLVLGDVPSTREHALGLHLLEQLAEAVLCRDALDLGHLVLAALHADDDFSPQHSPGSTVAVVVVEVERLVAGDELREAECRVRALGTSAAVIGGLQEGCHEAFVAMRAVGQLGAGCVYCCTRQVPVLRPGL